MYEEFKAKTLIVTGGASGIGLLTGQKFYEEGANVVLVDINGERLQELQKEMPNVYTIQADITKFEEVKKVVEETFEKYGSIDYMVNCAGGNSARILNKGRKPFCDRDIEDIIWGTNLNLMAPVFFCHEVMRYMRDQKSGVIINIGSITGEEGDTSGSDYSFSKTGVMYGLTKSMAKLGAPYGVRCCCVSPGPILTRPGMASMSTLLGRAGETIELVEMILFLCSNKASFITGTNYMVDGGRGLLR